MVAASYATLILFLIHFQPLDSFQATNYSLDLIKVTCYYDSLYVAVNIFDWTLVWLVLKGTWVQLCWHGESIDLRVVVILEPY